MEGKSARRGYLSLTHTLLSLCSLSLFSLTLLSLFSLSLSISPSLPLSLSLSLSLTHSLTHSLTISHKVADLEKLETEYTQMSHEARAEADTALEQVPPPLRTSSPRPL